ncbi:MAG: hypothetical protein FIB01_03120 [Gemmatimonadetes bacterium]|nr:hypothetical protein [Gemmatimonadota bacterium]
MVRPVLALLITSALSASCAPGELPPLPAPRGGVMAAPGPAVMPGSVASGALADSAGERAGRVALAEAVPAQLPLQEAFFLAPEQASAVAWSLHLRAGQALDVEVLPANAGPVPVLELLQATGLEAHRLVAGGRLSALQFEAPATGTYVLRARDERGRGGGYRLVVRSPRALAFPVAGRDAGAIRGDFGDRRAGGRRDHDGVDIFAPRGTPVLAAGNAVVARVETDRTGGRVIWAFDEARNLSYFYAHLERQLVKRGATIGAGDTIGTVGNTGNARGSSPHLHFGLYRPGMVPVDPAPFLAAAAGAEPELPSDSAVAGLGSWARTRTGAVRLRAAPDRLAPVRSELGEGTVVRLVGAVKEWRHIRLADGTAGFVANWLLAPLAGSF